MCTYNIGTYSPFNWKPWLVCPNCLLSQYLFQLYDQDIFYLISIRFDVEGELTDPAGKNLLTGSEVCS
jgi:hypothetical protein